jgi:hypothetical protein
VNRPPRARSSFVGRGMNAAAAERIAGIVSKVSGGNGGGAEKITPHSGSYGGGGPTCADVAVTGGRPG